MPEKIYKGNPRKKVSKHGYRARKATSSGRKLLKRRTLKGRVQIAL